MRRLPSKVFNRATSVFFNTIIYTTKDGGKYRLIGARKFRQENVCILYTIPNNKNPKLPHIKAIQREEMDKLWSILMQNRFITSRDCDALFPELYNEGSCYFSAFYGIINCLFPKTFSLTHGKITII